MFPIRFCTLLTFALVLLVQAGLARAQSPFGSPALPRNEPPRDVKLVEKKPDDLSEHQMTPDGYTALKINFEKWKHAETENFIIHYRRITEAQKVAREVEYDLWFVAKTLGATKDRYRRKSNVFVFEDEAEWKEFVSKTSWSKNDWVTSFAMGDDLFLNIRRTEQGGHFDSETLAHETTHAIVARLYPGDRWPLWLNEGFAEYMAGASVAARKNQTVKRHQRLLSYAELPLEQMVAMKEYPQNRTLVAQLYETGEKFVRFLFNDLPPERFPKFVDAMLKGEILEVAIVKIYGDKYKDFDAFKKKYQRFQK